MVDKNNNKKTINCKILSLQQTIPFMVENVVSDVMVG